MRDWIAAMASFAMLLLVPAAFAGPGALSRFDHQSTGFPLQGAHARASCGSCHSGGRFLGVPRECDQCHRDGGWVQGTSQPVYHIAAQGRCSDCHRENAWSPVLWVDHDLVLGTCSSCHNNARIAGQPPDHIVTPLECDSCHNVRSWSNR